MASIALAPALAGTAPAAGPAPAKVHPRVWADTEGERVAHFLVLLAEQTDAASLARQHPDWPTRGRALVAALRHQAERSQGPVRALLRAHGATNHTAFWIANAVAARGRRRLVAALARRPEVRAIESDAAFLMPLERPEATGAAGSGSVAPTVPPTGAAEWGVARIGAPELWALGYTGQGIVYANADTGVQWDHPALRANYRGWDGSRADHNYHWWDAIHGDLSGNGTNPHGFNSRVPVDDHGHGTHTLGTGVGAEATNQIGVASGARWIACRNMDEGWGRPSTYLECFQFFLAPTDLDGHNPNPDLRPHVLGNSYACVAEEFCAADSLRIGLETLRAAGVFLSVSAGNEGPACGTVRDPPGLDAASFTVGATDAGDQIAGFSSRGPVTVDGSLRPKPQVVAPGVGIRSALPPATYGNLSGTSMAAPHVAGAVALLWSAWPHLRRQVDYTSTLLEQTAVRLANAQLCGEDQPGQWPNNVFGWGRIDVLAAFQAVNQPPLASNQTVQLPADGGQAVPLAGADPEGAPITFQITAAPGHGLLLDFDPTNGLATYRPAHGFVGQDAFSFVVSDGVFLSEPATVNLEVAALADEDDDGMPTSWEQTHDLDPLNPEDAGRDDDGDGHSNLAEYQANTDPRRADSVFRILRVVQQTASGLLIEWQAVGGTRYRLEYSDEAGPGARALFQEVPRPAAEEICPAPPGAPGLMQFVEDFSRTGRPEPGGSRFYRISLSR